MSDHLVPDPAVAKELGRTLVTLYRWDRDPAKVSLGWPPQIKIGLRNYRSREHLEQFKANLIQRALSARRARSDAALIEANEPGGAA